MPPIVCSDGVMAMTMPTNCRYLTAAEEKTGEIIAGGNDRQIVARQTRIERATPAFGGLYSIQLSYWRAAEQAQYSTRNSILPMLSA